MKKGMVCEGVVERVDFPNRGIVRVCGERESGSQGGDAGSAAEEGSSAKTSPETSPEYAVVKNVLPGQRVRFRVSKLRKGRAEGLLLEVTERSSSETGRVCEHFGSCGGCTCLSLTYEDQLKLKEGQMRRLLEPALADQKQPYVWEGIKGSPKPYEYRNKMEFSFGDEYKGGPLALGMHKRGSFYDVVTVSDCAIVDEDYRLILRTVRDYFAEREVPFFHRLTHEGYLRHLLVRKAAGTGKILTALVTTSQSPWAQENLIQGFLDRLLGLETERRLQGSFAGILHIVNDSVADVVRSDETRVLFGGEAFQERLLGLEFTVSTFSFFQTNSHGAEVLYETVREFVGRFEEDAAGRRSSDGIGIQKAGIVFDLYSGTGTIAQLMAPVAERVIGVEIVEEAVEAARAGAAANGLTNCEFIAGDVLKVLDELRQKQDLIILDPPRDGVHPKALPKILNYQVERIVYISCKPTSLVRDLEAFRAAGYRVERAVAVDQFPWTANCELVALLVRGGEDRP